MKQFIILSILFCLLIGSIVTAHTLANTDKANGYHLSWMFSDDPNEVSDPNDPNEISDPNIIDPGE